MRTARSFLVVVTLVLFGGAVPSATGAEGTHCKGVFDIVLDPGLSMQPSTGSHRSERPGTVDCDGPVNGHQPSGAGTLTQEGLYGTADPDSCQAGGEATGTDHLTVPTAEGPQRIDSEFTATFGKLSNKNAFMGGEFTGSRFTGSFTYSVLEGDCVTKPITKARVTFEGFLHD